MSRSAGASTILVSGLLACVALAGDGVPAGVVRPLDPATNPSTAAKVALGRKLFADRRISADGSLSCTSCHLATLAFTDGRPVPIGIGGAELKRNAPTLLNVGLVRDLFHDGRAPSLEEQARQVFLNPDELGWPDAEEPALQIAAIDEYPPLFVEAFGDETVTLQRMLRAIAAFERTLLSGDAPFDVWWRGEDDEALDAAQQRGYRLFIGEGGCVQCHSIRQSFSTFADGRFHNTGAGKDTREGVGKSDPGRMAVTGDAADRGAFRTPTLRNIELTGPYMHDGSLRTLDEIVDFYVDGGGANPDLSALIRPLKFDERDRADLVAFLRSLTSPDLPRLEECDRLLAEGRPREALPLFRAELARNTANSAALFGLARSALAIDEREPLLEAERLVRARLRELTAAGTADADAPVATLLLTLGDVSGALSNHEDAMAIARAEDALLAFERVRLAAGISEPQREQAALRLTEWLELMGRRDRAVDVAEEEAARSAASPAILDRLASVRYRRAWRSLGDAPLDDDGRADLRRAAEVFDDLADAGILTSRDSWLFRAYARHYLGDVAGARESYLDAVRKNEIAAEGALAGLRSLLANDLPRYRADVEALISELPDSPAVLYFAGWESLQQGQLDEAEFRLRRRLELEETTTAGPHVYLARIEAARGDRDAATGHYAVALALDRAFSNLVAEYEAFIRSRELDGFRAVDALIADYDRFLATNPDDRRFQCLARNNLAFLLREVAASFTSRGAARIHTFPDGVPDDARRIAGKCLRTYEEAVALIPEDVESLELAERWVYAGVLNDTALILHYFAELQDLAGAEKLYLRAFELTDGAYMDAYVYNLQFLYGFELEGREESWYDLAAVAMDAILQEDPASPTGFSPDLIKRRAARRDFERLAAALGR